MSDDGKYLYLVVFNRKRGRNRFVLIRSQFSEWLERGAGERFYDTDGGNMLIAYRSSERAIHFTMKRLSHYGDGELRGYELDFAVPISTLWQGIVDGRASHLDRERTRKVVYDFSRASSTLQGIIRDERSRRALSKALRTCFQWRGTTEIRFFNDFPGCFGFRVIGGWEMNGGLIRHEGKMTANGKQVPKLYYSVHT